MKYTIVLKSGVVHSQHDDVATALLVLRTQAKTGCRLYDENGVLLAMRPGTTGNLKREFAEAKKKLDRCGRAV